MITEQISSSLFACPQGSGCLMATMTRPSRETDRTLAVTPLCINDLMTFSRRIRIVIQRLRVRHTHRRACRAYDRLVDLENP